MTTSELVNKIYSIIEAKIRSTPSAAEFEMAYQMRVVADRIKFAITQTEQLDAASTLAKEIGIQLLDALGTLGSLDRHFQTRFRNSCDPENRAGGSGAINAAALRASREQKNGHQYGQ